MRFSQPGRLHDLVGNILNVPAGRSPAVGDDVELVIANVNEAAKQITFKWPT
ncbi:hypothetical protein [Fimbriiglobus ruber]|uniref:Uncharacterized protein n=1 Tax=Fimbriiglobus ruber TaxID=1908690 RepID=A0A225DI54_9BACT|nr:hypothetical protein [Fimbriiglobus ruber]OWK41122.1 hypothetical protein FRUB_05014 [Fimbriiglobus ruber]